MQKKEFGEKLFKLRKEKGASQAEVAEYINLTVAAYQNYENGRREAGYDTIAKLADFYGVTTDYLLGRPNAEPPADPIDSLVKGMTVQEMEADLMHRWLGLNPKAREAFLQVLRDIVHEDDKRKQAKESADSKDGA